jgi:hypothetical protein
MKNNKITTTLFISITSVIILVLTALLIEYRVESSIAKSKANDAKLDIMIQRLNAMEQNHQRLSTLPATQAGD